MKKFFRKNIWRFTFVILLVLVLLGLLLISINQELKTENKFEISIQLIGMALTTTALFLTYRSLRISQKQKHEGVRPYVVLDDLDFQTKSKGSNILLDFDYTLFNYGPGIAYNITVSIKRTLDGLMLYKNTFVRLPVFNYTSDILKDIRAELNHLARKDEHTQLTYINSTPDLIEEDFIIENSSKIEDYYNLTVVITYNDIYKKKYEGKFLIKLDDEFHEIEDMEENIEEFDYI